MLETHESTPSAMFACLSRQKRPETWFAALCAKDRLVPCISAVHRWLRVHMIFQESFPRNNRKRDEPFGGCVTFLGVFTSLRMQKINRMHAVNSQRGFFISCFHSTVSVTSHGLMLLLPRVMDRKLFGATSVLLLRVNLSVAALFFHFSSFSVTVISNCFYLFASLNRPTERFKRNCQVEQELLKTTSCCSCKNTIRHIFFSDFDGTNWSHWWQQAAAATCS